MQRGRGGARYPRCIGASTRVPHLLLQHVCHAVGHGPHALANLRAAGETTGQPDLYIAVFVGPNPGGGLDVRLAQHRACLHRGMHFIASTVEKACVDEHDAVFHRMDAGREVRRSAALFVHDTNLNGVARQFKQVFHRIEQAVAERDFFGAMHLRLHDVNAAGTAIADAAVAEQVVLANQRSDGGIENTFRCLVAIGQQHGRRGHQVADVAHEQQATAGQCERSAVCHRVLAVRGQAAHQFPATLVEAGFQRALHQAQPMAVGLHFVGGVYGGHRVFEVDDSRQCRFEQYIGQTRGVGGTYRVGAVHHQLNVQAVVAQQEVRARAADELRRVAQGRRVAVPIRPATVCQWHGAVEKGTRGCDDLCTTYGVVALAVGFAW